jgi:hypothetical protein
MSIFKNIENQQNFSSLDLEKGKQDKKVKNLSYHPLHYALIKKNYNYATQLITYLEKHDPEKLNDWYFNDDKYYIFNDFLRQIFFKKDNPLHEQLLYSVLKMAKNDEQANHAFYWIFQDNPYRKNVQVNFNTIKENLQFKPQFNHSCYIYQYNLKELIEMSEAISPISIEEKIKHFKEKMINYDNSLVAENGYINLYHPKYPPKEVLFLQNILHKMDNLVMSFPHDKATYQDAMQLKSDIEQLVKNLEYDEKLILLTKTRETQYLKQDKHIEKLKFYQKTLKQMQDSESIESFFNKFYFNQESHSYNHKKRDINTEELTKLQILLEEKNFKSITFDSSIDICSLIKIIQNGSALIEKIFKLESSDVGAEKLALLFTTDSSVQGGNASYLPGGDMITYYNMDNTNDINLQTRHLVHEYTHYLQDIEHYLSKIKYDDATNHLYDGYKDWQEIEKIMFSYEPSRNDILSYCTQLYHYFHLKDTKINQDNFFNHVENHFDNNNFIEKTKEFFNHEDEAFSIYKNQDCSFILNYLKAINNASKSTTFFKTLWENLDDYQNLIYFKHQVEMHARVVEALTEIESHEYPSIWYPNNDLMNKIKPNLEKFNQFIAQGYKEFLEYEKMKKEPINFSLNAKRERYLNSFKSQKNENKMNNN